MWQNQCCFLCNPCKNHNKIRKTCCSLKNIFTNRCSNSQKNHVLPCKSPPTNLCKHFSKPFPSSCNSITITWLWPPMQTPMFIHPLWPCHFFCHLATTTMQQAFLCSSLPCSTFYLFCSKIRTCLPQRHELSPRLTLYKTTQYSNNNNTMAPKFWPAVQDQCVNPCLHVPTGHLRPNYSSKSAYSSTPYTNLQLGTTILSSLPLYWITCTIMSALPHTLTLAPSTAPHGHCSISWVAQPQPW